MVLFYYFSLVHRVYTKSLARTYPKTRSGYPVVTALYVPLRAGLNPLSINALESNIIINALWPTLRQSAFVVLPLLPLFFHCVNRTYPGFRFTPLKPPLPDARTLVLYVCVSYCFYDLANTNDPVLLENGKRPESRTKGLGLFG